MTAHGYSSLKGPFVTGDSGKSASLHKKKVDVAKLKMIQETRTEIYPSPFDFFVKTLSYETMQHATIKRHLVLSHYPPF